MEELASLYVMLANGGLGPVTLKCSMLSAQSETEKQMLSPEACYLVREMLRKPDVELGADDPAYLRGGPACLSPLRR